MKLHSARVVLQCVGPLLAFFALAYAIAWTFFLTASLPAFEGIRNLVVLIGVFAPAMAALALTARAEGSAGVAALLQRVVQWRVSARWYVFAVVYFALIKLSVALVHRLWIGSWPRFGGSPWYVIVAAIVISTPFQSGEEIGWRGFALPRLAARFGFGSASILVGVLWAAWHIPLFFVDGGDTQGQSFPLFLVEVTALSVAMAWLYVRTGGSLLLTMIMHSAVNQTHDIVPSAVPGAMDPFALSTSLVAWLTAGLLWLCAAYFLLRIARIHSIESRYDERGRPQCESVSVSQP